MRLTVHFVGVHLSVDHEVRLEEDVFEKVPARLLVRVGDGLAQNAERHHDDDEDDDEVQEVLHLRASNDTGRCKKTDGKGRNCCSRFSPS